MKNDDCVSTEPKPLTPVKEALEYLVSQAQSITETETLNLVTQNQQLLGRVLAEPVHSSINVPAWDNSAMDGYAFNHDDIKPDIAADIDGSKAMPVSQRIPAGVKGTPLEKHTLARIFTGAPIPEDADTVVMQEHCRVEGDAVVIEKLPEKGSNIRLAGEDVSRGQEILSSGTQLGPQHLGMAASVGVSELKVFRRMKVAIFSSGDELVTPGEPLGDGKIYNSNRYTLAAMLQSLQCDVVDLGIVEDTLDATCDALSAAAGQADMILASGGVSVGEEDHVKPAVEKLGTLGMWKIAMRPGKPLAFGYVKDTPFIGTPGNPVSLFVTCAVFARPFIKKRQGIVGSVMPIPIQAVAGFDWTRPDKRQEYARARLEKNEDGQLIAKVYPSRSSGVLSSVTWADGLVVISPGEIIHKGEPVNFIPFIELLT